MIRSFPFYSPSALSPTFAGTSFGPGEPAVTGFPTPFPAPNRTGGVWGGDAFPSQRAPPMMSYPGGVASGPVPSYMEAERRFRASPEEYTWEDDSSSAWAGSDLLPEGYEGKTSSSGSKSKGKGYSQRRPSNRDEFDGPHQLLDKPLPGTIASQERELPHLATNLFVDEQDQILSQVNDRLSKCAFDFVAKYQFPIPLEPDKRPVRVPGDREWTEWVYLLKRLATKRRIPARVLYNGQIKQLITVLENSLEMRHAAKHQSRPLKDDRNVLQLISAGLQVAKILKDAGAMEYLDQIYIQTERMIQMRKNTPGYMG